MNVGTGALEGTVQAVGLLAGRLVNTQLPGYTDIPAILIQVSRHYAATSRYTDIPAILIQVSRHYTTTWVHRYTLYLLYLYRSVDTTQLPGYTDIPAILIQASRHYTATWVHRYTWYTYTGQ